MPKKDGVQFVTKYLAEGLVNKGHSVDLITRRCPGLTEVDDEWINGVHVYRWNINTRYTIHYGDKKKYVNFIKKHASDYDCLINIGTQTAFVDWILPILDTIPVPKILHIHSIWDRTYRKDDFSSPIVFIKKTWANFRWGIYYIVQGKNFKKYNVIMQLHDKDWSCEFFAKRYGIKSDILENAAEDKFFEEEIDTQIELPPKYILNVSNYCDRKNQISILNAFLDAKDMDNCVLIFIGSVENDYCKKLKRTYEEYLHKKNGTRKVCILTGISRDDTITYVKKADFYVMYSKWEAFPISITEAMAAGKAWISSDVGIVKYLPGGIIVDSEKLLKEKISTMFNDYKLKNRLELESKEFAIERFQIHEKVDKLESLIRKAIKSYEEENS